MKKDERHFSPQRIEEAARTADVIARAGRVEAQRHLAGYDSAGRAVTIDTPHFGGERL